MQQSGEQEPFVDEILRLLHRITVDLSPQQVCCVPLFGCAFLFFSNRYTPSMRPSVT
jgi:hypothetical protein